jgi:hypothetical protein
MCAFPFIGSLLPACYVSYGGVTKLFSHLTPTRCLHPFRKKHTPHLSSYKPSRRIRELSDNRTRADEKSVRHFPLATASRKLIYFPFLFYFFTFFIIITNTTTNTKIKADPPPPNSLQPLVRRDFLNTEASRSHSDTPHSAGLLWSNAQRDAETSAWQHTTLVTDRHPYHRRNSNPQSQQERGRTPTP